MQAARQQLPAWDKRKQVTGLIAHNQVVVISGMTGYVTQTGVYYLRFYHTHWSMKQSRSLIICIIEAQTYFNRMDTREEGEKTL